MKPNLKPCPICGSKAKYVQMNFIDDKHSIFCNNCSLFIDSVNKGELIKRWNIRHDEITLKKVLLLIPELAIKILALAILAAGIYSIFA